MCVLPLVVLTKTASFLSSSLILILFFKILISVFSRWYSHPLHHGQVLHVNYRGSIGYGTADLNSLPGKIGTQDVADCVLLTQHVLQGREGIPAMDRARVVVVGGSHGGFLGAHLSAQHPEIYKVRALRKSRLEIFIFCCHFVLHEWKQEAFLLVRLCSILFSP